MPIQNEMMVRAILVLAYARFQKRRMLNSWEAHCHIRPRFLYRFRRDGSVACSRVEFLPTRIIRDFEAAPLVAWNSIKWRIPVVDPRRQLFLAKARISCRSAEKEYLLARWCNPASDDIGKYLSKPGTAREYELVGGDLRVVR